VDVKATADLASPPASVFAVLEDLATYPHWLTIVGAAAPAGGHAEDPGPAWIVDLVGRIGPLSRNKRVRMVRVEHDAALGLVRFERREHDGRSHSHWILSASAVPGGAGDRTAVRVDLHYGGRMLPGADRILSSEIRRAGGRLQSYLDRDKLPRGRNARLRPEG